MDKAYCLRVDLNEIVKVEPLMQWLDTLKASGAMAVHEHKKHADGTIYNEHSHIYIRKNVTIGAIRESLLKKFPEIRGNKSYSLKNAKKDEEHNVRYMLKGHKEEMPKVFFNTLNSFTEEDIRMEHMKYWEINGILPKPKEKESFNQFVINDFRALIATKEKGFKFTIREVREFVFEMHKKYVKSFELFMIIRVENLLLAMCTDSIHQAESITKVKWFEKLEELAGY